MQIIRGIIMLFETLEKQFDSFNLIWDSIKDIYRLPDNVDYSNPANFRELNKEFSGDILSHISYLLAVILAHDCIEVHGIKLDVVSFNVLADYIYLEKNRENIYFKNIGYKSSREPR
jgi:hypothetical protein